MTMPLKPELDIRALEWIKSRSLLLAKEINQTTMNSLRKLLAEGFERGDSIKQITNSISDYFDANEKYRAEMTARTETIAAFNEGALQRYEEEGISKSEFYPSPDACEECQSLIGDDYITKESHNLIPVHPNCRCTWLPIVEPMNVREPTTREDISEQRDLAYKLHESTLSRDEDTTAFIKEFASENSGKPVGLEFRVKTPKSTIEKILTIQREKGLNALEASRRITDSLRYTITFPEKDFASNVRATQALLEKQGFKIFNGKDLNYFKIENSLYKGYNTVYVDKVGRTFELQFHTVESYRIKNNIHAIYETYRTTTDKRVKDLLEKKMQNSWKNFNLPEGYMTLGK